MTAGFCEAVKQGAIANRELFDKTARFLEDFPPNNFKKYFRDENFISRLENLISAQISFKAEIVAQDERENTARTDAKSRKILNFGHTLAHALEKVTGYKYFKHGEAVGYGILFAAELSKKLDIFDKNELKLLNDVVHRVGQLPDTSNIERDKLIEAFVFDKKAIGDSLQWILLERSASPKSSHITTFPNSAIKESLDIILQK